MTSSTGMGLNPQLVRMPRNLAKQYLSWSFSGRIGRIKWNRRNRLITSSSKDMPFVLASGWLLSNLLIFFMVLQCLDNVHCSCCVTLISSIITSFPLPSISMIYWQLWQQVGLCSHYSCWALLVGAKVVIFVFQKVGCGNQQWIGWNAQSSIPVIKCDSQWSCNAKVAACYNAIYSSVEGEWMNTLMQPVAKFEVWFWSILQHSWYQRRFCRHYSLFLRHCYCVPEVCPWKDCFDSVLFACEQF